MTQPAIPRSRLSLGALLVVQPPCLVLYQYLAKSLGDQLTPPGTEIWAVLDQVITAPVFWGMVAVEIVNLILWLSILSRIDLGKAFPLTAISYCLIMAISVFVFHEAVNPFAIGGSVLILCGIALLATEKETA
ncbi:hypothetical protein AEAC466_05705 [Asticcacaulis sp. AC466]|uniref:hypothetical protein n=1 Tax=Asticcacaulis sp. AC466 TaxID=1282362 RepID=UPI0003C3F81B|nr:hypothetical protein [Asticcacaulis sp. AC466]ESQ85205.1 hypothetical protein AEAC466_05705 [Asticcacaulis sp. AC466]